MERFKKRTIALVLASVVTVVGAFGASNYKNTLMGIKFESPSNGNVNLILETKSPHAQSITPMRRDANTYIITLPEVNNMLKNSSVKDDSGIISSTDNPYFILWRISVDEMSTFGVFNKRISAPYF